MHGTLRQIKGPYRGHIRLAKGIRIKVQASTAITRNVSYPNASLSTSTRAYSSATLRSTVFLNPTIVGPAHEVTLSCPPRPECSAAQHRQRKAGGHFCDDLMRVSIRTAHEEECVAQKAVERFSRAIRLVHKKHVTLEGTEDDGTRKTSTHTYLRYDILEAVVQVINQLSVTTHPVNVTEEASEPGYRAYVFSSEEFRKLRNTFRSPIIVYMDDLEHDAALLRLSEAMSKNPGSKIVVTDLSSLYLLHSVDKPPNNDSLQPRDRVYEEINISDGDLSKLRIIVGSLLYDALDHAADSAPNSSPYIHLPEGGSSLLESNPCGPIISPDSPLPPDEAVFQTYHKHSDFDLRTLVSSYKHARQFLRWKKRVMDTGPTDGLWASVGSTLQGETHGFSQIYQELKPYYSNEPLSKETKEHMDSVRRPEVNPEQMSALLASQNFSLELIECLSSEHPSSRSVPHQPRYTMPSANMCVKLFLDRYIPVEAPEDDTIMENLRPSYWLENLPIAEEYLRREDAVYKKLEEAQGSLLPRYYGAHKFQLPSGLELFGILTEYVESRSLQDSESMKKLTVESQAQLAQSARHAIRLLQSADFKRDWHAGQILCVVPDQQSQEHAHTDSSTTGCPDKTYCVLIDFAAATFSMMEVENHRIDDYGEVLLLLTQPDSGLDGETVWRNYSGREIWDTFTNTIRINGGTPRLSQAADPFEFVYGETKGESGPEKWEEVPIPAGFEWRWGQVMFKF